MSPDPAADPPGHLSDVPDVLVGHWSDTEALTGCTVVVVPSGTIGSAEIRGGAPASRELALLDPTRTVGEVDAVVLTGGSAFGLAATDGVMAALEEHGRGVRTPAGRVPIVPTLALFDLAVGDARRRPGAREGRAAFAAARPHSREVGAVGAGTGCTVGKWLGPDGVAPGGLVSASERVGDATVAALIAVNAFGSVGAASSQRSTVDPPEPLGTNTTVGVLVTDATLDKLGCHMLARAAHDGLARAVFPSHTRWDGDAFISLATGATEPVPADLLQQAACAVVERAVLTLLA